MRLPHHRPIDRDGANLKLGDLIRIVSIPDLSDMAPPDRTLARPVFEHILGTYKKIKGFDSYGNVELIFKIQKGRAKGLHIVAVEPFHLKRKSAK